MYIDGIPRTFYGHEVYPNGLMLNVILAIIPLVILVFLYTSHKSGNHFVTMILFYVWLLFLPNSVYLIFEYKHILWQDGVADAMEPEAVQGFQLLAGFGLLLFMIQVNIVVNTLGVFKFNRFISIIGLSLVSAWGGVLGLQDIHSISGLLDPEFIFELSQVLLTQQWITFACGVGGALATISSLPLLLINK